ncbi:MAG: hypothetical protein QOK15_2159 [Nocardioidaceae bacterium]|nr:hypothetical protein [Nocardioidaceae bacterium]
MLPVPSVPPVPPDELRRWRNRALLTAVVVLVLVAFARVEHTTPLLLPMVLLVGAVVAIVGLVLDAADFDSPEWDVAADIDTFARGGDPGLATNVRLIENHLRARGEDEVLPRRLAGLAEARLRRLGVNAADPVVREQALGPTLGAVLEGKAHALRLAEIEECLRRIEELS